MARLTDPEFAPPIVLPFPAGMSPFRQKGNGYLGDALYLDSVVPGGFEAVVAALPDPATRAFFGQTFCASEWYDAYPGAQLEVAAAHVRGLSFEAHRRETGAWHAQRAARGVYGALLRLVSNESVAVWGPRISAMFFEFGKTRTRATGPKEVVACCQGIPRDLAQWMVLASAAFGERTLSLAGAREPRVTVGEVQPDGHAHGRDLVRVDLTMTWR